MVPDALLAEHAPQLILTGPHGMGHSAALVDASIRLTGLGHDVTHIDCRNVQSVGRLAASPNRHAILLHSGEFASVDLLATIAQRISAATAPLIVGWDDSDFSAQANQRIEQLRQRDYELADAFQRLHPVPLLPWHDRGIEALVHQHYPRHPDALTVNAVRTLAIGRPMWALELTRLAAEGLITSNPRPTISRLDPKRWDSPTMQELRRSHGALTDAESSAAIALSSLEQFSKISATQVFGAAIIEKLLEHRMLVNVDKVRTVLAPVGMLTEPMRHRVDTAAIARAEDALAAHLLALVDLGITLNEAELRFCANNLVSSGSLPTADSALQSIPTETRGRTLQRAAQFAADFGRHDTARTLLVAAARMNIPGDPLELVRAIAGRDDPMAALSRLSHGDLAGADEPSVAYLTSLLRAEAGITQDESSSDEAFLLNLWNQQDPLSGPLSRVHEIAANLVADVRLRLLADSLLLLASSASGLLVDPRVSARARHSFEEISRPGLVLGALGRDAKSTYVLTLAISEFLNSGTVRAADFRDELSRLDWPASHSAWLRLFEAASLALAVGDTERAEVEWEQLLELMPRFAATRITRAFHDFSPLIAARGKLAPGDLFGSGYIGLTVAHWSGDLDGAARLLPPTSADTMKFSPQMLAIREVVSGDMTDNPSQLIRGAEQLSALGLWSAALSALGRARKILIRRRSSGAIITCNAMIAAATEAARTAVAWEVHTSHDTAPDETHHLTAREAEIASLAANGLSNKEIAVELGLSIRTIESHLAQARGKLGAPSRANIAEYLHTAP